MNVLVEAALQNPLFISSNSCNKIYFHVFILKFSGFIWDQKKTR
jgi:hypothetical protein